MKMEKRIRVLLVVLMGFLLSGYTFSLAETAFPNRPIELVIPFAPGGGADIVSGAFKERVAKILGQPPVSIYKPGAGGGIATAFVAKSKPDGYTLLVGSNTGLIIVPLTQKGLGYTLDDFAPVCNLSTSPLLWCVKDDSPYKTMQDFIQTAKTKKMKYSTYGVLSMAHICMEAMGRLAGFQAIHIPYPGAAPAMTAALGGHVDISITAGTAGMVGPGRLRILVVSSDKRFETYPDVPTLKELGYPISVLAYFYLWAPKDTPKERITKTYEAFKKVADEHQSEISKILLGVEHNLLLLGPDELWKAAQADYVQLKKMIEEMGALAK